jgi:uncharacterized protein YutE (UPF0331/DUF86 family)
VIDRAIVATKVAAIRDATRRIRDVLPNEVAGFLADRTVREVVAFNLLVALQESIDIATHTIADAGWAVPTNYRDVFQLLVDNDILDRGLGERLVSAAGFRNLLAHRYGMLDWARVYTVAQQRIDDLDAFCGSIADAHAID